jgi:hypothetical protein
MRTVGTFATLLGALMLLGTLALFIRSLPEIRRFLKVRNM